MSRDVRSVLLLLVPVFLCVGATGVEGLPQGLSSLNPSGLSADWIFEGTAFQALRFDEDDFASVPVYRLRHPSSGYRLTVHLSEVSKAEEQGSIREGIAFYAPRYGDVAIHQFRKSANGSYYYAPLGRTGPAQEPVDEGMAFRAFAYRPSRRADDIGTSDSTRIVNVARYRNAVSGQYLFTAGRESPYVVGAFYFGSFSASARGLIAGVARVHDRQNDWWGGVSDFYGREPGIPMDRRGWDGNWAHLKPAIGYYDQGTTSTLQKQIHQAVDAGLSFFSFYWYWSRKEDGERFPEALRSFLLASNSKQMKFSLSLFAHPWDDDMRIDAVNAEKVVERIVRYFQQSNYLRLPDGRPVILIGDFRNFSLSPEAGCSDTNCRVNAVERFIGLLRQVSTKTIGVAPFVQIQAAAVGWDSVSGVDGVTCVVPPMRLGGGVSYPKFSVSSFSALAKAGKPVSPCMLQNFDERPRQDVVVADRQKIRYLVGKTDALFRHNLLVAKEFSDTEYERKKHPASRIVYLYAWNEWHEGGILEPNVSAGARELNIVTDVFRLPRSPSRCLDHGVC